MKLGDWFYTKDGQGPFKAFSLSKLTVSGSSPGRPDSYCISDFKDNVRPATEKEIKDAQQMVRIRMSLDELEELCLNDIHGVASWDVIAMAHKYAEEQDG